MVQIVNDLQKAQRKARNDDTEDAEARIHVIQYDDLTVARADEVEHAAGSRAGGTWAVIARCRRKRLRTRFKAVVILRTCIASGKPGIVLC